MVKRTYSRKIAMLGQFLPGEIELQRAAVVIAMHVLRHFVGVEIPAGDARGAALDGGIDHDDRNVARRQHALILSIALLNGDAEHFVFRIAARIERAGQAGIQADPLDVDVRI